MVADCCCCGGGGAGLGQQRTAERRVGQEGVARGRLWLAGRLHWVMRNPEWIAARCAFSFHQTPGTLSRCFLFLVALHHRGTRGHGYSAALQPYVPPAAATPAAATDRSAEPASMYDSSPATCSTGGCSHANPPTPTPDSDVEWGCSSGCGATLEPRSTGRNATKTGISKSPVSCFSRKKYFFSPTTKHSNFNVGERLPR